MRRFMRDWPGIELGLSEPATDPELYGLIESGELDLAFCSPPLPDGPFDMLELMSDPYVLLVPAENPLASRASASMDDLGDQPLIGSNTCASGVVVERSSATADTTSATPSARTTTARCRGSSPPASGWRSRRCSRSRPVTTASRPSAWCRRSRAGRWRSCWHRDRHRSPAARAFIEIARDVSADIERDLVEP